MTTSSAGIPDDLEPVDHVRPTGATAAEAGPSVRTLVLVRHAKAESTGADGDSSRPLSPRGTADAAAAGTWLSQAGLHADRVVCSPALRAQETWAGAVEGGASATSVDTDRRVYDATEDELLDVLRETSADVVVLVLVGHAPGVPALAAALADDATSDAAALAEVHLRYPTSAVTRLEYRGGWADLGAGSAALVEFAVPRA